MRFPWGEGQGTPAGVSPARGKVRTVRAAALGGTSLLLAATAHLVGGGRLPSVSVLLITAGVLGLTAVTLTARRCRFPVLFGVLAIQQVMLHVLFSTASTARACAPAMTGMQHHATTTAALLGCAPTAASMAAMPLPGWAMWAGHLVATLVTAWILARGEAWLWRVVERAVEAAFGRPASLRSRRPAGVVLPRATRLIAVRAWSVAGPRGPPRVLTLG